MRSVGIAAVFALTACASNHWRTLSTEQLESRLAREYGKVVVTNSLQFLSEANNWNPGPDVVAVITYDHVYVLMARYQRDRAPAVQTWSLALIECASLRSAVDGFTKRLRAGEEGTAGHANSSNELDPPSVSVRHYDARGAMVRDTFSPGDSVRDSGDNVVSTALACKT